MKKILLVDDEESIQFLYREEFSDLGYEVLSALNGEDALKLFAEHKPHLVVLDIQMPGINGIEVLRQMKMQAADVPVILCSAYHDYKQDLSSWASDEYVVKSGDTTELKEAVERLINR